MARKQRRAQNAAVLEIRAKIREAEKRQAPIIREAVGLDEQSYQTLAELVERGVGKKPDVLRQALATGLKVLKNGTAPVEDAAAPDPWQHYRVTIPETTGVTIPPDETEPLHAALAGRAEFGRPITVPPSQQRREEATAELEVEDAVV